MPTDSQTDPHHARRWLILAVLGLAQLMVVLDATIVNIALPSAQQALDFSDSNRQWIVTAYALAFGGLLLLGGRISDVFGRKRAFVVGLSGFAVASALGGAASSFEVLVLARALQGVFGALLAPAALSLLSTTFTDPAERGKAFAVYGAIAGAGGAVGLLLGGVLTEYLSWRWSMFVNLVFAVPAALGGVMLLRDGARAAAAKLDIPGAITSSAGLVALVYGFSQAESRGWGDALTIGLLAGGVLALALFVFLQGRSAHPLLPLRVLADRTRAGSFTALGLASTGMFGVFLFLTYYLQQTLGFSPIQTGLAFLPMIGALMISATLATTRLAPRTGIKPLVVVGMLLSSGAMLLLTQVGVHSTYAAHILPALLILGAAFGLVMAPAMSAATLGVAATDAGVASAMANTVQQVGGSIGTALLSTLAASAVAGQLAGQQPTPQLLADAAVHGYATAFWWSAGIFAAAAIICGLVLKGGTQDQEPSGQPVFAH
jgi:EmrB/QacA subfamily drug resistance transporter